MDEKGGTVTFYLTDKAEWGKFMKIVKREGRTASRVLKQYIVEYNRVHDPGNPQSLMSSFSENGAQTLSTIEGRVRQLCVEMHHKSGLLTWSFIIATIKDNGIKDAKSRVVMAERVRDWLRGRDVGVYQ